MKYAYLSETVVVKKLSEKDNIGVFEIEGLFPGSGATIGNALRRTLLSALPGGAITQIKIRGIDHDFSTLPGMMEDVVEFTLNLKQVRFRFFANEPQTLKLVIKGEKEVKAGDIQTNPLAEIVNPGLHLASLTKKSAELDVELLVEKGLGYVSVESRQLERISVGVIMLDAVFSPVVRVTFSTEQMRVGERTDYNRLKIEIETDGSISPAGALHKCADVLRDHFNKISQIDFVPVAPKIQAAVKEKKSDKETGKKKKKKTSKK